MKKLTSLLLMFVASMLVMASPITRVKKQTVRPQSPVAHRILAAPMDAPEHMDIDFDNIPTLIFEQDVNGIYVETSNADGDVLVLNFIHTITEDKLPAGDYTIQDGTADLTINPGSLDADYNFLGAWFLKTVEGSKYPIYYRFTSGTINVAYSGTNNSTLTISMTNANLVDDDVPDNAITLTSTASRELPADMAYLMEPMTATAFTSSFATYTTKVMGTDNANNDTLQVTYQGADYAMLLQYIVTAGTTTVEDGTYSVVNTGAENTLLKSNGVVGNSIHGSFMQTANKSKYFITGGTMTIATKADGSKDFTADLSTYNNSTVKFTKNLNEADVPYDKEPRTVSAHALDLATQSMAVLAGDVNTNPDTIQIDYGCANGDGLRVLAVVAAGETMLADGTYTVNTTGAASTVIPSSGFGSYFFNPTAVMIKKDGGMFSYDHYAIKTGTMVVATANNVQKITFDLTSHFGSTFTGTYSINLDDVGFKDYEPETATTFELKDLQGMTFENKGNALNNDLDLIEIKATLADEAKMYTLQVMAPKGSTTLPNGTYTIADTKLVNTAIESDGMVNDEPTGCYTATTKTTWGMTMADDYFFLTAGTIVVADDAANGEGQTIVVNATSHFGSTIKINGTTYSNPEKPYEGFESKTKTDYTDAFANLNIYSDKKGAGVDIFTYTFANLDATLSLKIAVAKGDTVEAGEYQVATTGAAGTIVASEGVDLAAQKLTGSFAKISANKPPYYFLQSGKLTIAKDNGTTTYTFDLVSHYGSTFKSVFTLKDADIAFKDEMQLPLALKVYEMDAAEQADAKVAGNNSKAFAVAMQTKANTVGVNLLVFAPADATSLPNGKYVVADTKAANTMMISAGDMTPSFAATLIEYNKKYYYDTPFYIAGGTLTVKTLEDGTQAYVFEGTSHFGSQLILSSDKDHTAVEVVDASLMNVYVEQSTIVVENMPSNTVEVYTIDGQKVYAETVNGDKAVISGLAQQMVYIVRCGDAITKIQL